jgi:hypothetical protein
MTDSPDVPAPVAAPAVDAPAVAGPVPTGFVRANTIGTAAFVVALAVALPLRDERPIQIVYAVVSMVLFSIGAVGCLWAYVSALERSRTDEIGVANLYLLTGPTAPPRVKRTMSLLLGAQVALAFAGAIVGAVGLSGNQVNALAFGILVPMFGLAMNALWSVRHGAFGPRVDRSVQPTNRKIG